MKIHNTHYTSLVTCDSFHITTKSGKVFRIKENEDGNLEIMAQSLPYTIAVKPVCGNIIEVC